MEKFLKLFHIPFVIFLFVIKIRVEMKMFFFIQELSWLVKKIYMPEGYTKTKLTKPQF